MEYIIDSYAWIEYFLGSFKGEVLKKLFLDPKNKFFTLECCLAEINGWAIKNNNDFSNLLLIIKANSEILNLKEIDWILAGEERAKQRQNQKDFGLIDSVILVKQKEFDYKIITGDKHFKDLKKIIFLK
ncbi:PIN domain-containing protein [Candidatus Pacearchaeota archaeon]|nr:PIN domain-containing protein [Candidatus Pacearchaeota archaeon]